jgi:hypothetical protein
MNCCSQAEFRCLGCGSEAHADVSPTQVHAERFDDDELNTLPCRDLVMTLVIQFMHRFPNALRTYPKIKLSRT